jgi:hypothetical protein
MKTPLQEDPRFEMNTPVAKRAASVLMANEAMYWNADSYGRNNRKET